MYTSAPVLSFLGTTLKAARNPFCLLDSKNLSNPSTQEFQKLLNSQLSKVNIEEGKIIEGKINKITEKYVFLFCEGLKSEQVLDVNELRQMGLAEKIKVGETIPVLLNTSIRVHLCFYQGVRSAINL